MLNLSTKNNKANKQIVDNIVRYYKILLTLQKKEMFSKTCEYGIRASIYIAEHSLMRQKVSLKDVAAAIESPEAYTSKILQQLSRKHIIKANKGPNGGFYMESEVLEQVKLSSIVMAIDGDQIYEGCGLGLKMCNAKKPCPVHHQFVGIRNELKNMLESSSIKSLAMELEKGLTFLKR